MVYGPILTLLFVAVLNIRTYYERQAGIVAPEGLAQARTGRFLPRLGFPSATPGSGSGRHAG